MKYQWTDFKVEDVIGALKFYNNVVMGTTDYAKATLAHSYKNNGNWYFLGMWPIDDSIKNAPHFKTVRGTTYIYYLDDTRRVTLSEDILKELVGWLL